MHIPFFRRKPAPPAAFQDVPLPYQSANFLSRAVYQWFTPILRVGASRPLQMEDLWTLTDDFLSRNVADKLHTNLSQRMPPSLRGDASDPKAIDARASVHAANATQSNVTLVQGAYDSTLSPRQSAINLQEYLETMDGVAPRRNAFSQSSTLLDTFPDAEKSSRTLGSKLPYKSKQNTPLTRPLSIPEDHVDANLTHETYVKLFGKKKARKIAEGKLAVEDGKLYDMDLI